MEKREIVLNPMEMRLVQEISTLGQFHWSVWGKVQQSWRPSSWGQKGGDQGEIAGVRGPQFAKNTRYDGNGWEGICPGVAPRLEECHAVAKNTGSLADSGVANRTMIAGHWWRRSWTTCWCMRPRGSRSPEVSDCLHTVAEGSDLPSSEERDEL